jgi:hypothetical protein
LAQYKNWSLFSYLVYKVNRPETITDVICLKYFEPGHNGLSADTFHFDDYVSCVQESNNGKLTTKPMQIQDFYDRADCGPTYKLNQQVPRPLLCDMVFLEARRGPNSLVYRTHFDGPDIPLNFLNARATKSGIQKPASTMTLRGIPLDKKNDILTKLGPLTKENRRLL